MRINVHELLYFERPTTKITYSDIPNENIEIPRLLNGQKPFLSSDTVTLKAQKKIIIDLGVRYSTDEGIRYQLHERIQQLQNEGFSVYYVHHKNSLGDYYENIFADTKSDLIIEPHPPTMEQLSNLLTLPVDELFVICSGNAHLLLSSCDVSITSSLSEIVTLRQTKDIRSVDILSDHRFSLSEIDAFISQFPTINRLYLKPRAYEELSHLSSYRHLSKLEIIDLDLSSSNISSAELTEILGGLSTKILRLSSCKNITGQFPKYTNFSALTGLYLDNSAITSIALVSLLKCAPRLENLDLTECSDIKDNFREEVHCSELISVNLCESSITSSSLINLLKHASKLEFLNLCACDNIKDDFLEAINCSALTLLNLNSSSITSNSIVKILAHASNLRFLYMAYLDDISDCFSETMNCSELIELDLGFSSISSRSLIMFLKHASKLKKLTLNQLADDEDNIPIDLRLSELEYLDVSNCNAVLDSDSDNDSNSENGPYCISSDFLVGILAHAKKLKILNLSYYYNIQTVHLPEKLTFPELEDLNFYMSYYKELSVTNAVLIDFLSRSPNIRRLNLSGCEQIEGDLPDGLNFSQLEELDVSESFLSMLSIAKILAQAKGLKRLNMAKWYQDQCENIDQLFSNNAVFLELEILNVSHSEITYASLRQLIKNSPKLRKLDISYCRHIDAALIASLQRDGLTIITQMDTLSHINSPQYDSNALPATYNAHTLKNRVDADTRQTDRTYQVDRIFMGKPTSPDPRDLRYQTFDSFTLNEWGGMSEPFILQNKTADLRLLNDFSNTCRATHPLSEAYDNSTLGHYFCRVGLQLTSNWQPLPSAFADEDLKQFYTNPLVDVELAKSDDTNLYYIRLKSQSAVPQDVTLEMLLSREKPKIAFAQLPQEVLDLAKFCRGFREEALKNIEPNATAKAFLEALIKQRVGSCRHRSIVFMHLMQQQYPNIPVRVVTNALHTFAEVYYRDTWVTCDLGGYPAHVQVNEQGLPEYQPGEKPPLDPAEVYSQTYSDTGTLTAPDFFKKARNLTCLTLRDYSRLPLQDDLSMLDTLTISSSPLTADGFQKLLTLAPNLKTLSLKHCTITQEDFNRIDFSRLTCLEHVTLSGRFIPSLEAVTRLMQTAPQARWIIESDNFSIDNTQQATNSEQLKPLLTNIEIRKKTRQLPSRYFVNRNRDLKAKKDAFSILKPSEATSSVRKTLVNAADAEASRIVLQKTAASLGQQHYYIDSPNALRCAGPYIRREGHLGHIENKRGGPLYDFITSDSDAIKNIIIDYNAFKAADFASFNSLLDDPSTLDGIELPTNVHIIGLLNQNNAGLYQGADFYSRFDAFESMAQAEQWPVLKPTPLSGNHASTEIIELCGGDQWEARLIGHWLLHEGGLVFKEGRLLEALHANKTAFSFNHAPLHDPTFIRFLHDLTLHGRIVHQGHDYGPLPTGFYVALTEGVYIPEKDRLLTMQSVGALTRNHVMLSQVNLSNFLGSYRLDKLTHQLIFQEGLIEQHKNNVFPIYLTSSLSFYTWLKLLDACRKHQTVLQVMLAPDVALPKELAIDSAQIMHRPLLTPTANTAFNPQTMPKHPDIVIDVSELKPDELLATFKSNGFNATRNQFEFTPVNIYPWDALKAGKKTVVLKGDWTQELADAVQTVVFARLQQHNPPGKLIIFSDTPNLFKAFPKKPLSESMKSVPKTLDKRVDYDDRFTAVEAALKEHPFVLITGATGIGKTHFVSRTWKAAHPACYYGENQMLNFFNDKSSTGVITLYLNEANLANKQWSMFEGLFDDPPAVFYNNAYYPLTSRHKIIFDGNPISYGGERHTPSLFKHHPYQLHFNPLPREALSHMIALDARLAEPILNVVTYMATLNPEDTLLTPREIKMMGSLVKASLLRWPHIQPEHLARYYAYTLCKQHVPHSFQSEFETRFKVESPFKVADATIQTEPRASASGILAKADYLINNSNLPAAIALAGHLMVREERRQKTDHQSLEIGLGGLVIEGESGEGKSALLLNQLVANGYRRDSDFIHIPAKSKPNEIKEKLLHAFHEGFIVVIDEMNSLPLPEQLLNALLEGHDLDDNPPRKPGFLLLGTQNPITYRGRLKTTAPLEHRLQKVVLPTSTLLEKKQILEKIGLPPRIAQDMIEEYSKQSDLTFRDVIKIAKQWFDHHQDKPSIQLDITPVKQVGSLCKTVAIANVENYYAKKLNYASIPLWSQQQARVSIRKLAKANGSSQGEILEFEQWRKTLNDLGFTSDVVDFHENMNHFVASIAHNLEQGNLPLIAFPVERESGLPHPETKEPEETEHAAVISGYNWQTDEFTLVHWGKIHVVDAVTLFNATHKLVDTRQQELYTKNPAYNQFNKWDEKKYLPTTDTKHPHIARKSIVPQKGTGFKAKLLIVQAPNKESLLQTRNELIYKIKETDQSSEFKRKYQEILYNQEGIAVDKKNRP